MTNYEKRLKFYISSSNSQICKKKAGVIDFRIDCCIDTNEELIEVNRCMSERVEQSTDEVKKLCQNSKAVRS